MRAGAAGAVGPGAANGARPADRSHRRRVRYWPHDQKADGTERAGQPTSRGPFDVGALRPAFVAVCLGAPITFMLLVVVQQRFPGKPVFEAAAFLALWSACGIATFWASRRYGTGQVAADTGLTVRAIDATAGAIVALAIVQVHALVIRAVASGPQSGLGPRSGFLTPPHAQPDRLIVATLVLTAVVGPIVEEVFFRGVVQSALASRFHPAVAVVGQAVVAGVCHANPGLGSHTLSVVAATSAGALVLGVARQWSGRLGPGLVGHSLYQVLVVLAVLRGA